jgi:SAM-dependent methyltransferase
MPDRSSRPEDGPAPKPSHWSGDYGAWFKDPQVVAAYHRRPPYPAEVIETLVGLGGRPAPAPAGCAILDVGAGTGDLARRLAPLVDRVDAVDFSAGMIAEGRRLPGGDHPHLRWIEAAVEEAPLTPPYALVTAGESLHWMAWEVVCPRFARALAPGGMLALVDRSWGGPPALNDRLRTIYARRSPVRDYRPADLIEELERRGLFARMGARRCAPEPWRPTIDEYVECHYSQRGFSRTHMGPVTTAAFDAEVREVLADAVREGLIEQREGRLGLSVGATVVWGRPLDRQG